MQAKNDATRLDLSLGFVSVQRCRLATDGGGEGIAELHGDYTEGCQLQTCRVIIAKGSHGLDRSIRSRPVSQLKSGA